jgi:hypothetical protein
MDQPLVNKKKKSCGTITFTLEWLGYSNAPELPRLLNSQAEEDANKLAASSAKVRGVIGSLSEVGKAAEGVTTFYETWQPLLDKIQIVVKIASTIAEVKPSLPRIRSISHHRFHWQLHPYGQMVWSVISPALEVCIKT